MGWEFSRDVIEGVDDGEFDPRGELGELECGVPRGVWLPSDVAVFCIVGSIIRGGRIDA